MPTLPQNESGCQYPSENTPSCADLEFGTGNGRKPLCIDLYCGLGGWAEGFLSEGYEVYGFDNVRHHYGDQKYPGHLILQDARTLHGSQLRNAAVIVASPPCTEYSYMAMPWKRAKQIERALRGEDIFPSGYTGSRTVEELNELFTTAFRLQREASQSAGRYIPLIVENVKGAQKWVGRASWHFGSFYLWGDVPALMPITLRAVKMGHPERCYRNGHKSTAHLTNRSEHGAKVPGMNWSGYGQPDYTPKGFNVTAAQRYREEQTKVGGSWFGSYAEQKAAGTISPGRLHGKNSDSRKAASAQIAKIPFPLAQWIAQVYKPDASSTVRNLGRDKFSIPPTAQSLALERCQRELESIRNLGDRELWLTAMDEADWEAERYLILKEAEGRC